MMSAWEAHIAIKQKNLSLIKEHLHLEKLNPNLRFRNDTLLTTTLHEKEMDIMKLFLEYGADPNLKSYENGRNEPPLITATRLNNLTAVKLLISHGADVQSTNFYGHDAIFRAVYENSYKILEYLLLNSVRQSSSSCFISEATASAKSLVSGPHSNQVKTKCPLILAIKEAPRYPLKKRCLFLLLKYNYSCCCLLAPERSVFNNDVYEYEVYYKIYKADPDILRWVYLAKGFHINNLLLCKRFIMNEDEKSYHQGENIQNKDDKTKNLCSLIIFPLKLTNLVRICLRNRISTRATKTSTNFTVNLLKLPLPKKMLDFLLLDDFCCSI